VRYGIGINIPSVDRRVVLVYIFFSRGDVSNIVD